MNEHGVPDYATANEHNNLRSDVKDLAGTVEQLAQNTYLGIESVHKRMDDMIQPPMVIRTLDTVLGRTTVAAIIGALGMIGAAIASS